MSPLEADEPHAGHLTFNLWESEERLCCKHAPHMRCPQGIEYDNTLRE